MDKIKTSKAMNRWTGGEDELLCYRIYVNKKLRGGLWIWLALTIDVLFYILRGERQHVFRNYIFERRSQMKHKDFPLDGLAGVQLHEWEFSHEPLKEEEDEVSQCKECRQLVTEAEAVIVKKFYGGFSSEITFCSESCATEWYIKKLREVDGR